MLQNIIIVSMFLSLFLSYDIYAESISALDSTAIVKKEKIDSLTNGNFEKKLWDKSGLFVQKEKNRILDIYNSKNESSLFFGIDKKYWLIFSSVFFGGFSMYYKKQANDLYFDNLLRSENGSLINKYDVLSGVFLGLLQINILYLGYLLFLE